MPSETGYTESIEKAGLVQAHLEFLQTHLRNFHTTLQEGRADTDAYSGTSEELFASAHLHDCYVCLIFNLLQAALCPIQQLTYSGALKQSEWQEHVEEVQNTEKNHWKLEGDKRQYYLLAYFPQVPFQAFAYALGHRNIRRHA